MMKRLLTILMFAPIALFAQGTRIDISSRLQRCLTPLGAPIENCFILSDANGEYQVVDSAYIDSIMSLDRELFYDYGTTDYAAPLDDSIETTNNKFIQFNGESNGELAKIKLLKEGILVFDKKQFAIGNDDRYIEFTGFDTGDSITFNINMHAEPNIVGGRMIQTLNMGWNFSPTGIVVPGRSAIGTAWEYNWKPDARLLDEWHLIWVDTAGVSHRFQSFMFDNSNLLGSIGGIEVPEFELRPLDTLLPYFEFKNTPSVQQTYMRMMHPHNFDKGLIMSIDADDNVAVISNDGLTNGQFFINNFDEVLVTSKLKYFTNGGTGVSLTGEDGSGYLTGVGLGYGIDIDGSGNVEVDSNLFATQNDILGLTDQDFYKLGTTQKPLIADTAYRDGVVILAKNLITSYDNSQKITLGIITGQPALPGLWLGQNPISFTNYNIMGNATNTILNADGGSLIFRISNGTRGSLNSSGLWTLEKLRIENSVDTPLAPAGRDAEGDVGDMTEGHGINYVSGAIEVDSSQFATQYDLTTISSSGSSDYTISPAQLTADQDNYNPTGFGKATHIRISSDNGMRAITSMVDSTGGVHTKVYINVGSYLIYFPQDHPDGTASNRLTGYSGDIYLFPGQSIEFWKDNVSDRWRVKNYSEGYIKPTNHFAWSGYSTAAADYGDIGINLTGTSTISGTNANNPACWQLGTAASSTNLGAIYFAKTSNGIGHTGSAHHFSECVIRIPTLSTVSERFTVEDQNCNSSNSSTLEPNNIYGVRYSDNINSGKWELFSQDNSGVESTPVDCGVTVVAGALYKIRLELDKSRTEVRAYINGTFVGRVTTNLPSTSLNMGPRIVLAKSIGTTARQLDIISLSGGTIYPY